MKYIYLLRHAKSDWDTPFLTDHERGLAVRGEKSVQVLRKFLESKEIQIDVAFVSDSRRTQETYLKLNKNNEIIKAHVVVPELYEASLDIYYDLIQNTPNVTESILFLGHNPELEGFANSLLGNQDFESLFHKFPTCACLCLSYDVEFWTEIISSKKGKLVFYFTPSKGNKL